MRTKHSMTIGALLVFSIVLALSACGGSGGGGGGSSSSASTSSTVPRFAYVANANDDTVSIYAVDATTGQLRARGYVRSVYSLRFGSDIWSSDFGII